ncbi:MAG: NmrA family NAD(P)-binding protein, partial [Planctomycetota bacterium]
MTVPVVVVAGATGRIGGAVARAVLARGGRVAAAVRKPWQVDKLRSALASDRALVGLVPAGDAEAAAGFVKG